MTPDEQAIELLRQLGLNQLESEVYVFLLQHPPVTAYRVGKMLGRPTANVYKAIEALSRRGAVLVEEGDNRLCRAVPADEFLHHIKGRFLRTTEGAADTLSKLQRPSFDERVYRVETVAGVLDRVRTMLAAAETIALVDAFPRSLEFLRTDIAEAVARGVQIRVEAYGPFEMDGADVVVVDHPEESLTGWGGEQLNVVVDGRQVLIALLDAELTRVEQAIWSGSPYLSCLLHAGISAELTVLKIRAYVDSAPDSPRDLAALAWGHSVLRDGKVPGHRELVARLIGESESAS